GVFATGTATFGSITLTGPGTFNLYVAKFDRSGNVLWAKLAGYATGVGSDILMNGIMSDALGNIYMVGGYRVNATLAGVERMIVGSSDMFFIKLNSDGNPIWVRTPGGVGHGSYGQDGITGIGLDSVGNCYITGHYNGDASFDSITITSELSYESFVAKYDSAGKALWARTASSIGALHIGQGIAVDREGNSYITGRFFNDITFGGFTISSGDAEQKGYIAKLDPDGIVLWAREIGSGGYYGAGNDIAVDSAGNAYVVGFFRSTIHFSDADYTYDNELRYAVLIVKYDRDGNYQWSGRSIGTDIAASAAGVCIDRNGNAYMTGSFSGTADFGPSRITSLSGRNSAFIVKMSPQGSYTLVTQISGSGNVFGSGIAVTKSGEPEIIGVFTDTVSIGARKMTSFGNQDIFFARLSGDGADVVESGIGKIFDLMVSPNPAGDFIRLNTVASGEHCRIFSMDGVCRMDFLNSGQIDISALPTGIYFVKAGGHVGKVIRIAGE
ncbi:MAG: SBBP repeat-containing protein, partial [Bacteroidota bacterium]